MNSSQSNSLFWDCACCTREAENRKSPPRKKCSQVTATVERANLCICQSLRSQSLADDLASPQRGLGLLRCPAGIISRRASCKTSVAKRILRFAQGEYVAQRGVKDYGIPGIRDLWQVLVLFVPKREPILQKLGFVWDCLRRAI